MKPIFTTLDTINKKGGISFRQVAELMNTRPETVSRWKTGRAAPHPEAYKKLASLSWLVTELSEFYDPEQARMWLFTPQRLLNGETPAERIEADRLDDVIAIIKRLQDGAFS